MRHTRITFTFTIIFSICLIMGLWVRSQSQALVIDIFSMPLGYDDGFIYSPHPNTFYGMHNVGLQGLSTCFGVDWYQLYHSGVDLYRSDGASTVGAKVTAVANGSVVFAQDIPYPGYVVIVKHDDPFDDPNNPKYIFSMYGHLESSNVQEGDLVSRGDVLGTVKYKPEGPLDDSHLHFEIRYFEDASNIYPSNTICNGKTGKAGAGYTYPEHPDDFPMPGMGYTDPLTFITNRGGLFLPMVNKDPTPTITPTPTETATPLPTATPTATPTSTPIPCVAGVNLVQNGNFEDPARHHLWVSDTPNLINAYQNAPNDYLLVMGYEENVMQTVYQTLTIPPGVRSVAIKFQLFVRTREWLPQDHDYLFVDLVSHGDVAGAALLHDPFPPFTNRSPTEQWTQQILHVDDVATLNAPLRLRFYATTDWSWATAFSIDNVQLITVCQ